MKHSMSRYTSGRSTQVSDPHKDLPEKEVAKEPKPDTGVKPDLKNPESADEQLPVEPAHDMDPSEPQRS